MSSNSSLHSEKIHGLQNYRDERSSHWDTQAERIYTWDKPAQAYHMRLEEIYQLLIPKGARVIELGCGAGNLLAAVRPEYGVGVDISKKMLEIAVAKYPNLIFTHADAHDLNAVSETFDFVILSDLLNELHDVQSVLNEIHRLCDHRTRVIFNFHSNLWFFPLRVARNLGLATQTLPQNWLTKEDVQNLCKLTGLEFIRSWEEILLPLRVPLIDTICNKFLCKVWPFNHLSLTHMMVARLDPAPPENNKHLNVSIVVPARNEAGNIAAILERTPKLGSNTELIFVEGGSADNTYETIDTLIKQKTRRINKAWRNVLKIASMDDFHYHDLRHTFCSNPNLSGSDLNAVKDMIGHKDLSTTDRYSHLTAVHKKQNQEKLAEHYAQ